MTPEDIIRMARQVGGSAFDHTVVFNYEEVQRFMALVAAAERKKMVSDGWRQCAEGQRTTHFCAMAEQARQEERAACADICDQHASIEGIAQRCAVEIRARNNP